MKEKFRITRNSISIIGGICFILFALVIFFSNKTPFAFLSKSITTVFGFVGYWFIVPFIAIVGIYLIFRKKLIKIRVGLSLWGFFIIIFFLLVWLSYLAANDVEIDGLLITGYGHDESGRAQFISFSNSLEIFKIRKAENDAYLVASPTLGGGYVGFVLAGAINSAISPIGLNIICWLFFVIGLAMMFNTQVTKLVKLIKDKRSKKAVKVSEDGYKEVELSVSDDSENLEGTPNNDSVFQNIVEEQPRPAIKPVYGQFQSSASINNDYELKKAHFVPSNEPVIEDSLVKKLDNSETSQPEEINSPAKAVFDETVEMAEELPVESHEENIKKEEFTEPFFSPLVENEESAEEPEEIPQAEFSNVEEKVEEEIDPLFRPQPKANLIRNYIYPSLDLLDLHEEAGDSIKNEDSCMQRTEIINETLKNLKVGAQVVGHTVGPSVTRYDLQTNPDVSVASVLRYINDISIRLGGTSVRFEQIVAGKSTSGLEIPNEIRTNVGLRESIAGLPAGDKYLMSVPFGKNITGNLIHANMTDFPHMLISGTTGSGKSIFVHSTILTLLMRNKPEELKLILIDPKKVEMTYYDSIPHLLCPVISDPRKSYVAMQKLVDEMERRYNLFMVNKVRDIRSFNAFAKTLDLQPLPYIVVFVDEYADLVDTCKEIKDPITRLVQKARAAGIHLVIATQRPSVNVIDGVIKGNFSTRVALMSASAVDSMTIIGEGGAEKLLGNGDMLIDCPLISRSSKPRVQGCYVSDAEITRVCDFLRNHYQVQYDETFLNLESKPVETPKVDEPAIEAIDKSKNDEEQYQDIKNQIIHREYCSISFIQRNFAMGFGRAGRIFERLKREGIVQEGGDSRGSKVLVYEPIDSQVTSLSESTFTPNEDK